MSGLNDDAYIVGRTLLSVLSDKLQEDIDPYALSSLAEAWSTVVDQVHSLQEPELVSAPAEEGPQNYITTNIYNNESVDSAIMAEAVKSLEDVTRRINNLRNVHLKEQR